MNIQINIQNVSLSSSRCISIYLKLWVIGQCNLPASYGLSRFCQQAIRVCFQVLFFFTKKVRYSRQLCKLSRNLLTFLPHPHGILLILIQVALGPLLRVGPRNLAVPLLWVINPLCWYPLYIYISILYIFFKRFVCIYIYRKYIYIYTYIGISQGQDKLSKSFL